jgi:hypothetical protein
MSLEAPSSVKVVKITEHSRNDPVRTDRFQGHDCSYTLKKIVSVEQCWGSDILVPLTNDPDPDPTSFYIDIKDAGCKQKYVFFLIFFLIN